MVCAQIQILTDIQEDGSEIKVAVSDNGQFVRIFGRNAKMSFHKEDLCELIHALMAADAYMDLLEDATQRLDRMAIKIAH